MIRQKTAVGVIGLDLTNLGRIEVIRAYCARHGYKLTGVAHDVGEAQAMVDAGTAEVIVLGAREWLSAPSLEVVAEEMHPRGPTDDRSPRAGRRPHRLR